MLTAADVVVTSLTNREERVPVRPVRPLPSMNVSNSQLRCVTPPLQYHYAN